MKNAKYFIIAVACICLICGGFFFFVQNNQPSEKELTEVEKVIAKDLKRDYPKTPREVVKLYNRIVSCYYGEKLSDKQIEDLADQMLAIMDEDLLLVNEREDYYRSVRTDIEKYQQENKKLVSWDVCSGNEVKYLPDKKEGSTEEDKLAYVDSTYFMNINGKFGYTYQQFVLRQDEKGDWKLLTFYEVEGESSDDE